MCSPYADAVNIKRCPSVGRRAAQAPMLYCGEQIGDGAQDPKVDIAVDPLDGTTLISQARPALLAFIDIMPLLVLRSARVSPGVAVWLQGMWSGHLSIRFEKW